MLDSPASGKVSLGSTYAEQMPSKCHSALGLPEDYLWPTSQEMDEPNEECRPNGSAGGGGILNLL